MANPSIVNATAVGKEVVRRYYVDGLAEAPTAVITGVANHIMTTVSIIISERSNLTDSMFNIILHPDGSGTGLYLMTDEPIPSKSTFVFNDRMAITGTDILKIEAASPGGTCTLDVWATYIDQQFAAP
jgi:hypothetical protein